MDPITITKGPHVDPGKNGWSSKWNKSPLAASSRQGLLVMFAQPDIQDHIRSIMERAAATAA